MFGFMTIPVVRLNVPGPSRTKWLAEQDAIALLMAATDAPAEIVEPHWVQLPEGIPPTTPGEVLDQSTARLGARTPDQS